MVTAAVVVEAVAGKQRITAGGTGPRAGTGLRTGSGAGRGSQECPIGCKRLRADAMSGVRWLGGEFGGGKDGGRGAVTFGDVHRDTAVSWAVVGGREGAEREGSAAGFVAISLNTGGAAGTTLGGREV